MPPRLSKFQTIGIALLALSLCEDERRQKRKRIWMKRRLMERKTLCHMNISKILHSDDFRIYLRMDENSFKELLEMVRPLISKQNTHMRKAVSAEERLIATLRFLATGKDYRDLKFSTVTSHQLLSKMIPETCSAIFKVLRKFMKFPTTENEWEIIAKSFQEQWQFDNCVGCMDGKHIIIKKPRGTQSSYYNYKGTFSVVLFGIVNANYEFIYVDGGANGDLDQGILRRTVFYEKLLDDSLNLPESCTLPGTDVSVPYVFLGDSAFPFDTNIMIPFPEENITDENRIFNYRLNRARRIAENTLGILSSRFRVLRQPIGVKLENVNRILMACCALHNFLIKKSPDYLNAASIDHEDIQEHTFRKGEWRELEPLLPLEEINELYTNEGPTVRTKLVEYFNGVGKVDFQDTMAYIVDV